MTPNLNRSLKLDTVLRTRDAAGGFTETWAHLGTHWAEVSPGTGREAEIAGLTLASVPLKIVVRAAPRGASSRPMPGQRFREADRVYKILAVTSADPKERFLTCYAQEEQVAS